MGNIREINEGALVRIHFSPYSPTVTRWVKKYDGTIHRVSKVVAYKIGAYYQLEGVVGKNNVPFSFTRSELELVRK